MVPGEPIPPLRICFFNRSYYPDLGATGQLLTELAEDLAQQHGCDVTVVAGVPSHSEQRGGVRVIRAWGTAFRPAHFAGRVANYVSYFFSACLASFFIQKPNVIVSLTDPPVIGLTAWFTAKRTGAKFVFLCEDIFPEVASLVRDFRSSWADRLLQKINRFLVQKSDRIVAIGETMRERLITGKGADPKKVAVIHNWADCSAITPLSRQNSFSAANGLVDRFVVMHSGNMGLSQDLGTLIRAAEHLRDHRDILLAMVGDGVQRPSLMEQARSLGLPNVRFFSYQPRQDLSELFASADLFIISLRRGLAGCIVPSKLYGILAAGRPFIAAVEENCEAALIAKQRDCGLLAEPGNAFALAQKILALYSNRALTQRLGQNARQAALLFDRSRAVDTYYKLFSELA